MFRDSSLGFELRQEPLTYALLSAGAAATIGTLAFLNRPRLLNNVIMIRRHASVVKWLVMALTASPTA